MCFWPSNANMKLNWVRDGNSWVCREKMPVEKQALFSYQQNELEIQRIIFMSLHQKAIWEGNWFKWLEFLSKALKASFLASPSAKEMSDQREKLQQIMEATGLWYCSVSNKSSVCRAASERCSSHRAHVPALRMTVQVWLAARSCLGDFPLPFAVLMEAAATAAAAAGVINHLPSCRSCTSWPCSCAGNVASRINGYWWTCLATSSQLAAIPGDAQLPPARTEAPTLCGAVLGCKRQMRTGLCQLCVLSLSPVYALSKPRLVAPTPRFWPARANIFSFRTISRVSLNCWLWIGIAAVAWSTCWECLWRLRLGIITSFSYC